MIEIKDASQTKDKTKDTAWYKCNCGGIELANKKQSGVVCKHCGDVIEYDGVKHHEVQQELIWGKHGWDGNLNKARAERKKRGY